MLRQISALLPEEMGKSLLVVLILLAPGSFLLLPALALFRLCTKQGYNGAIRLLRDYLVRARSKGVRLFKHLPTREKQPK